MFRNSPSAVNKPEPDAKPGVIGAFVGSMFLLGYFILLPVLVLVVINWLVYAFTANNIYHEHWMMPALLLLSTFLAGTLMRQKMEDEMGGMGLFFLGVAALFVFSWLTYSDIDTIESLYSRLLPRRLPFDVMDYVFALPAVGILGMLFYKYFTLKHYS